MKQGTEKNLVWSMKRRKRRLEPWQWSRDYFDLENRFLLFFSFLQCFFSGSQEILLSLMTEALSERRGTSEQNWMTAFMDTDFNSLMFEKYAIKGNTITNSPYLLLEKCYRLIEKWERGVQDDYVKCKRPIIGRKHMHTQTHDLRTTPKEMERGHP